MTNTSITVALSDSFTKSTRGLTQAISGKIWDTINKFQNNPDASGLNLEALSNDLMSIRIDQTYRIILKRFEAGRSYVFLWADHHDRAYDWAANHRAELVKGLVQIFPNKYEKDTDQAIVLQGIFTHVPDYDLELLKVPTELYPYVRSFKTVEDLNKADSVLHPLVHEALAYLSSGIPVSEIHELMKSQEESAKANDQSDSVLNSSENRSSLLVLNQSQDLEVLQSALSQPMSKWRHFLHPSQRYLVEKNYSGPVHISGGPGTGKTVVALHRAKFLAENTYKNSNGRILLTTFNTNMAENISSQLRTICDPDCLRKIDVLNVDLLILKLFQQIEPYTKIVFERSTLNDLWSAAIEETRLSLDFPLQFYIDEWSKIVQPQRLKDAQEYLSSNRLGRGTRLSRKQKLDCWRIFSTYRNICLSKNHADIYSVYAVVTDQIKGGYIASPYTSIIIDEAQDFDNLKLSFIRALAGEEHENDLFIVGDERQRIYQKNTTLIDNGINIDNRRHRLRMNYRTTEQIRQWATNLYTRDVTGSLESTNEFYVGHISLMGGHEPKVMHFSTMPEEFEHLDSTLLKIAEDGGSFSALNDVCLTFRTNRLLNEYKVALQQEGYEIYEIKGSVSEDMERSGLRLATMHRVKGLEFDHIIVCAANAGVIPNRITLASSADELSRKELEENEKNLLFVAATRAKLTLHVFSHGTPSPFIE